MQNNFYRKKGSKYKNIKTIDGFDSKKEIISHEFPILVALEFNLMIKYETDFISHYDRILNNSDYVKFYEKNHFSKTIND